MVVEDKMVFFKDRMVVDSEHFVSAAFPSY